MEPIPVDKLIRTPSLDAYGPLFLAPGGDADRDGSFRRLLESTRAERPAAKPADNAKPSDQRPSDSAETTEASAEPAAPDRREAEEVANEATNQDETEPAAKDEAEESANEDAVESSSTASTSQANVVDDAAAELVESDEFVEAASEQDDAQSGDKRTRLPDLNAENPDSADEPTAPGKQVAVAHEESDVDATQNPVEQIDGPRIENRSERRSQRSAATAEPPADASSTATKPETVAIAESITSSSESGAPRAGNDSAATNEAQAAQAPAPSTSNANGAVAAAGARLPQHLAGNAASRPADGGQQIEVDAARFVQRVARAFQAAQDRGGEIRLRLHPPELGSLRLEVKVEGGVMSARIEAETASARSVLLDNLPALRQRLADQGIRVEQFDVDISDRQPGGLPDGPADHRSDDRPAHASHQSAGSESPDGESSGHRTVPQRRGVDGQLNVVV